MIDHEAIRQICPDAVHIVSNNATSAQIGVDAQGKPIFDIVPVAYDADGNQLSYNVQQAIDISKLMFCKQQAKRLLADTDWAALPDVGLANGQEFTAYRASVRALMITPVEDPQWPTQPTAVWS